MLQKLKNTLLLSLALGTVLTIGAVGRAAAESSHFDFTCSDGNTDIVIGHPSLKQAPGDNFKSNEVVVTCSSGANIGYPKEAAGVDSVGLDVTCLTPNSIGVFVNTPTTLMFNCVLRQGSHDDPTDVAPTPADASPDVKQGDALNALCPDNVTSAPGGDVSQCTTAAGGTVPPNITDGALRNGNCSDITRCDLIVKYIDPFVRFLSALVGVVVVISIIIGAIQYGSSAGDSQKVTAAKDRIRDSIIALLAFLFLFALLNFLIPGGIV